MVEPNPLIQALIPQVRDLKTENPQISLSDACYHVVKGALNLTAESVIRSLSDDLFAAFPPEQLQQRGTVTLLVDLPGRRRVRFSELSPEHQAISRSLAPRGQA